MFTDKLTLAIAEAAKKCMDEDLVGNQHKIDANKNGKIDADDFKKLRKEELKGNQHKIDANKNGKIDADDFKKLRKEETVNESEGKYGYVAFSHDGKRHELYANTSYEAKQKAVKHFNPPKSKQHLVTVHLAQKDGKDVTNIASEAVQEAAIDDLRDRQAAAREANPYDSKDKKEPVARKIQGSQYGGSKQKQEKEVEESVQLDEISLKKAGDAYVKSAGRAAHVDATSTNNKEVQAHHKQTERLGNRIQKKFGSAAADKEIGDRARKAADKGFRMNPGYNYSYEKEEVELDESKSHIEQHLADRDINAKVTGKTVKVHSSDVASATKHVKMAGYKDHKVVGGLNEEKMSDEDMAQRERIVKGMKKNLKGFKQRYGERAKEVMYATATKQAMKEEKSPKKQPAVVHTNTEVGSRVSEIGPGGKEYNVKTDSAWDKKQVKKEEVEQIDEISKDTLKSYVKKAEADKKDSTDRYNAHDRDAQGMKISDRDRSPARKAIDNLLLKRSDKRVAGLKTANAKLAKEETEKKSDSDKWKEAYKQAKQSGSSTANARARANGAVREEVTNDGFKAELEDNKAKAAGTKKQPDVAKAAVQSVKQESFSQKLTSLKEGVRTFLKGAKDE